MKIYVLICIYMNHMELEKIFKTKELAQEWIENNDSFHPDIRYKIEEWEVQGE